MESENLNIEVKKLYSAPKYLEMVRKSTAKNEEPLLEKPEIGKAVVLKKRSKSIKQLESVARLVEKLRSFKNLSPEEFKRVFDYKSEETAEFYKIIGVQLPLMSEDTLIHAINFANSQVGIDWAFRARCVAEIYERCPRLLGGRYKKAKNSEGRGNLTRVLAEKFNTSETNIKLDARIHQKFSVLTEIKTSADSAEVLPKLNEGECLLTRSEDNEFFIDLVEPSEKKEGINLVRTFIPHYKLTREHYVIASRLDDPLPEIAIREAITEVEANRTYTAADMKKKYFPRKMDRAGHFKLCLSDLPKATIKLEVTFDELDGEVFCTALAKALQIPVRGLMKGARSGIVIEEKGFDSFMEIMKTYIEAN